MAVTFVGLPVGAGKTNVQFRTKHVYNDSFIAMLYSNMFPLVCREGCSACFGQGTCVLNSNMPPHVCRRGCRIHTCRYVCA